MLKAAYVTWLCRLVKHLADPVDVVADGRAFLLLVVEQVNRVKHFKVVNLALYRQQQIVVNILANDGKVDVGACTIIAFRPGTENQNLLDVRMTAKHILQFRDNRIAESEPHSNHVAKIRKDS